MRGEGEYTLTCFIALVATWALHWSVYLPLPSIFPVEYWLVTILIFRWHSCNPMLLMYISFSKAWLRFGFGFKLPPKCILKCIPSKLWGCFRWFHLDKALSTTLHKNFVYSERDIYTSARSSNTLLSSPCAETQSSRAFVRYAFSLAPSECVSSISSRFTSNWSLLNLNLHYVHIVVETISKQLSDHAPSYFHGYIALHLTDSLIQEATIVPLLRTRLMIYPAHR